MKSIKLWWYNVASGRQLGFLGLIALITLWLVSLLYRFILLLRACLYKCGFIKPTKLPCPVISIGNITVGGTGKTPMTEYLAKYFAGKNKKVVVLSRGYGKVTPLTHPLPPRNNRDSAAAPQGERGNLIMDDEKLAVSSDKVIRLTGANRSKLGEEACAKYSPQVILLDDGFQHWRIARNLDIVMIDCLNPFGNWHVFPAGILREHLNALKRADIFILAHTDLVKEEHLFRMTNLLTALGKPVAKAIHKPVAFMPHPEQTVPPMDLAVFHTSGEGLPINPDVTPGNKVERKKVWAFCGIGNPDSFRLTLEKEGFSLVGFTAFPDHYRYKADDILTLSRQAKNAGAELMITTSKDIGKIHSSESSLPIYALQIKLVITEGKEKLEEMLGEIQNLP
jgi:tetraacyldisaccharide 4'-kinase